ncbi:synaptic vesicle 2-related protein [Strongylocentrotus purpuratus]|uniref:Major facilitator superfamily (MFS) profile domain-containing protein n=1 Tax=Strongylocentrotus purpuratus TaxID=7668 RepID=A0A7M7NJ46_STRPU|nr:synaptic vesicle 2-related protein [Strongylocentrotus purpuratus]
MMDEMVISNLRKSVINDAKDKSRENSHRESEHACLLDSENDEEEEYTVEEAIDALGFGWFQIRTAGIVGFQVMADAFEIMLISVLSIKLKCEWKLSSWQQALFTTVVFGGYFLSAPLWGMVADKLGRRTTLYLCSFYIFYFGALSSFSPNYFWLLFLRGLVGFGLGGASQGVTILAEFLPSKTRGLCLVFISVFWVTGVCLQVIISMIVVPTLGWRYLMFFSSLPLLIFMLFLKFVPESILFQQGMGNMTGAMKTLKMISRLNKRPLPPGRLKISVEIKPKGKITELCKTKSLTTSTCILLVLWFFTAFLYYGIVLMSTELFSSGNTCASEPEPDLVCFAGCRTLDRKGYLEILVTSLAEYPGTIVTFIIIEWFGRRKTISFEMFVASIFSCLLFLCTSSNIQMAFIFIVRAMIGGTFQTLYVYTPEVYPTHVRALSLGVCVSASRIGAILTPFVAQVLIKRSVVTAISVYVSFSILSCVMSLFLPIETKGKILQ